MQNKLKTNLNYKGKKTFTAFGLQLLTIYIKLNKNIVIRYCWLLIFNNLSYYNES